MKVPHGVVNIETASGKRRTVPAAMWHNAHALPDDANPYKQQGWKIVTNAPPPVEARKVEPSKAKVKNKPVAPVETEDESQNQSDE